MRMTKRVVGRGPLLSVQAGTPSTPTAPRSPQPKSPFPAPVSSAVVSRWRGESARLGNEMSKL
jgi:hypothetical protein